MMESAAGAFPRGPRALHGELEALQEQLVEMAGRVEEIVHISTTALLKRDPSALARIRIADDEVDALELEIDERVTGVLALHNPVAKDLRQIMTTLKVTNDLERVGDHGLNIAKSARRLSKLGTFPELPEVEEMIERTRGMLSDALAAFVSRNSGTARMVVQQDDRVDNLRSSLFRILATHMLEDPRRIGPALEYLLVSQNLERIADLCTNVAEEVVYLVEGKTIRHGGAPDSD
jgi:phosphate transport system protein